MKSRGLFSVIVIFSLALFSCGEKEDMAVFLPFSSENQACITTFLASGNLDFRVVNAPFEIESPESYSGVIKLTPDKNRDMDAVYNTLKYDCYPTLKVTTRLSSDNWESLSKDLNAISLDANSTINKNKTIYINVDISKKTYSIFQK
jgi:hypothetical protein